GWVLAGLSTAAFATTGVQTTPFDSVLAPASPDLRGPAYGSATPRPILLAQAEDAGGGGGVDAGPSGPPAGPPPAAPPSPIMAPAMAPPSTYDPDSPYADLLALGNGGAAGGNAPPYYIVPHIALTEIFTDNASHGRTNRVSDLISIISAGVSAVA